MTRVVPELVMAVGVVLVVTAVAALAGAWWSVGLSGVALIWMGYAKHTEVEARQAAARKDGS